MLNYITSNKAKIRVAEKFLSPLGVTLQGKHLDLTEIQSEDIEQIAVGKARQAFSIVNEPLFVNDAGWYITSLGGFPGPFMKYVNQWLTSRDLLAMMSGHSNKEVIFREVVCYVDKDHIKTFVGETKGLMLEQDTAPAELPSRSLISLSSTGKSIAECWQEGVASTDNSVIWKDFSEWYATINPEVK
jgi:non-canonical purine NTP pyrophosphatase (RdgB/HAM1 family)